MSVENMSLKRHKVLLSWNFVSVMLMAGKKKFCGSFVLGVLKFTRHKYFEFQILINVPDSMQKYKNLCGCRYFWNALQVLKIYE